MGFLIDDRTIDDARDRINLVDVIEDYVSLKQRGANYFGVCPFHDEKTASFAVHPGRGTFKCFGCGESGDVYGFLMKVEGMSFPEAIEQVCNIAGVNIPNRIKEGIGETNNIYYANDIATETWQTLLFRETGEQALKYLLGERGLTEEIIKKWEIGYAPQEWDTITTKLTGRNNITEEELISWGLSVKRKATTGCYDRFRKGITIPIKDRRGRKIGFAARTFPYEKGEDFGKFINSPETDFYSKSKVLFGLDKAAKHIVKQDCAIIVEGYFDLIQLHENGFENSTALGGTALTDEHVLQLKRLTNQVVICLDSDDAGRNKAISSGIKCLEHGLEVKVVEMPDKMDPDDVIRIEKTWENVEEIPEEQTLDYMIHSAKFLIDFQLDLLENPDHPDKKIAAIKDIFPVVAATPSPVLEVEYLKHILERYDIPKERLWKEYSGWLRNRKEKGRSDDELELAVLSYVARVPSYRLAASKILTQDDFSTEERANIFGFFTNHEDPSKVLLNPDSVLTNEEGFQQLIVVEDLAGKIVEHYEKMKEGEDGIGVRADNELIIKTLNQLVPLNGQEIERFGYDYVIGLRQRSLKKELRSLERDAKLFTRERKSVERKRALADILRAERQLKELEDVA